MKRTESRIRIRKARAVAIAQAQQNQRVVFPPAVRAALGALAIQTLANLLSHLLAHAH